MIYTLIGFLISIIAFIEASIKRRKFSDYSGICIFCILISLASLRNKVGTDWDAYFSFYKNGTEEVEIGYAFLNNLFSGLKIPYNFFLLFINGISLTLMYSFLRRHSIFMVLGSLMFFSDLYLYFNLSGIRQALAMSFTCFSMTYALKKDFARFFLLILVASCFHLSAIIFVFAFFLPRRTLKISHIIIVCLGFLLVVIFLNSIADLITLYTMKSADYYINIQGKADNLLSLFYVGIAKRCIIVAVVVLFGRKIFQHPDFRYYFNIYLFGFAIYLSTYMISPDIGVRMSSYFIIFDIAIAGNLIVVVKSLSTRVLIVTIFVGVSFYKIYGYTGIEYFNYNSIVGLFDTLP